MTEAEALQIVVDAAREARDAAEKAAAVAASPPTNWLEWVRALPSVILYSLIGIFIAFNFHRFNEFLQSVEVAEISGIKFNQKVRADLEAAADEGTLHIASTIPENVKDIILTEDDKSRVLKRTRRNRDILKKRRILWVDDNPQNNAHEASLFTTLGAQVSQFHDNDSAIKIIAQSASSYHVIISDIARENQETDGIDLLDKIKHYRLNIPIIFYVTQLERGRALPNGAFGITNRPDELVHLVLDALERIRPLR